MSTEESSAANEIRTEEDEPFVLRKPRMGELRRNRDDILTDTIIEERATRENRTRMESGVQPH